MGQRRKLFEKNNNSNSRTGGNICIKLTVLFEKYLIMNALGIGT